MEDCTVEHMFRLGRPSDNGKDRPLLVKLSTEKEKWTILSRAKRLKNSTGQMGKVYINRDMSKEEIARDYELRTMLAEKRRSVEIRGKLINNIAEVEGTEERMTQPSNEEGDMRTGVDGETKGGEILEGGRAGFIKSTHISMISNSVTHLRSYTNIAIADFAENSAPISPVTPHDRRRRHVQRRRLRIKRRYRRIE